MLDFDLLIFNNIFSFFTLDNYQSFINSNKNNYILASMIDYKIFYGYFELQLNSYPIWILENFDNLKLFKSKKIYLDFYIRIKPIPIKYFNNNFITRGIDNNNISFISFKYITKIYDINNFVNKSINIFTIYFENNSFNYNIYHFIFFNKTNKYSFYYNKIDPYNLNLLKNLFDNKFIIEHSNNYTYFNYL